MRSAAIELANFNVYIMYIMGNTEGSEHTVHRTAAKREADSKTAISPSYATNMVGSRCTASDSLRMAVLSSFFISATDAIQYNITGEPQVN